MREFPSCLGEHGVQVADSFASGGRVSTQNVVTCFYKAKLAGTLRVITVNWCKTLGGQGLSVSLNHDTGSDCTCKVDMRPWLFWKKKGSKALIEIGEHKVELFWDLVSAKYNGCSPEPTEGFYIAVVCERQIALLLGDMPQEAFRRAPSCTGTLSPSDHHCESRSLISRKEHIFGKAIYVTRAQFGERGKSHDISIECDTAEKEPWLCIRLDKKAVVQVKRLMWKFRGNQTIMVDGFPVELLWDVHNWLFNPTDNHAVFMFQTGPATSSDAAAQYYGHLALRQYSPLTSSKRHQHVLSSKLSSADQILGEELGYGFSLLLYAWKSD